ncbi:MAG: endonuclease III [Candidatus Gracilibacteria bacterium]
MREKAVVTRKSNRKLGGGSAFVNVVLKRLLKIYPDVHCALHYETVFQLLVATILSAQCTDVRVNMVTPKLFEVLPDARAFAHAKLSVIQGRIKSINFFRNKAKHIQGAAMMILKDFGGEVPRTMEEIMTLPGVARKTANVVLGVGYGILDGVCVDTHVRRLSLLLGLTKHQDPEKIEQDLMKSTPRSEWNRFSLLLIQHGRQVCIARRPQCGSCVLSDICPSSTISPRLKKISK